MCIFRLKLEVSASQDGPGGEAVDEGSLHRVFGADLHTSNGVRNLLKQVNLYYYCNTMFFNILFINVSNLRFTFPSAKKTWTLCLFWPSPVHWWLVARQTSPYRYNV